MLTIWQRSHNTKGTRIDLVKCPTAKTDNKLTEYTPIIEGRGKSRRHRGTCVECSTP